MTTMQDILALVEKYVQEQLEEERFVPGETWVKYSGPHYDSNEYKAAIESLLSGWLILGEKGRLFEQVFSPLLGKKYGSFVNSGSSANLLMMAALTSKRKSMAKWHLPPGSKIITPVTCFPTTVNPIIQCGFDPVFCDVELPSLNLDLDDVERLLFEHGSDIRAITFAHVLGNPPNMDRVMDICKKHNLLLLEDSCDALGSTYDGKPLGSFGIMSTCSFFPAHHMTSGEGGFVATSEKRIDRVLRSFRDWGRACFCNEKKPGDVTCGTACGNRFGCWFEKKKDIVYDHRYCFDEIGYNLKPLELQAAMALEQVNKLPALEQARRENFKLLYETFKPYEKYFHLPKTTLKADPCWFAFLLTVKDDAPFSRLEFTSFLEENKIQTRTYFTGNILYHNGYQHLQTDLDKFPVADKVAKNSFFLGTFIGLTEEKMLYINEVVDSFFTKGTK